MVLKMIATGCFLTASECTKFVFPDPAERACSARWFKGPCFWGWRGGGKLERM